MADGITNAGAGASLGSAEPNGGAHNNDGHVNGFPVEPINAPTRGRGGWPKGKPRKSAGSAGGNTDRAAASGPRSAKEEKKPLNLATLAGIIETLHELAAMGTGSDKWKLDEDESQRLAKALMDLQKYYPSIDLPGVVLAWVNLATACTSVYGPRLGSAFLDAKAARQKAPAPAPMVVNGPFGRA